MKWHPFSDVITDATSKFTKIKASGYQSQGLYKIIDQGKELIAGYTDDANLVNGKLLPVLIFGDHTRALKYADTPIALGADGAKALWVNPELADARYVYYYLRSIQIKEAGYSRHFKFLKEIEIPIPFKEGIPDFESQLRIAHLLGKVEGLIAQRKRHLHQLDELLKSVFLEIFGDPMRNERGWDKPPLRAFGKISTGNTPPRSDSSNYGGEYVEWIKTDNITADSVFVDTAAENLSETGAKRGRIVSQGALLVACIAGSVESIGRAALTDRVVAFNQQINAVQPAADVHPLYLYGLFKLSRKYIQSQATKGMKKILTKGDFEQIPMIKPPFDLQQRFAVAVEKIEILKARYRQSLADLEVLYGALSQHAFRGELDLSRVSISAQHIANGPIGDQAPVSMPTVQEAPAIVLPMQDLSVEQLSTSSGLQVLLAHWLDVYSAQLGKAVFSQEHFVRAAQQRLGELHPDVELELGKIAHEYIKDWCFAALENGQLVQVFDEASKCIQLKAVQA
ncbi:restriction endonuclease subunit S [Pseudomonas syringae]|uniref:restriction endonuclease subunit S n=1 Tax=Pseudomonas syringae TaxID=317 RepID=UPI001BCB18E4|nr:restriction endonuclease subunit S [Pseudomonas syringae]MBS7413948.1 restriction endonuclease subunit S [Pseudomonas syringae]QVI74715.1 restriction endonuclease subunit S [Pseudomonas syringae]